MRRVLLALGGAAVLAVTGCSGGAPRASTPTTRTHAAAAPNPDVIPRSITPAYVDAVFVKLNHVYGDAVRQIVASGKVTARARVDLRSIYNDPLFKTELNIAQQSVAAGFDNVRRPPGDRRTIVERMITARTGCIFVQTTTDFSAVIINPTPPAASEYYELTPKQRGIDPKHLNRTPWALSFNQAFTTSTEVKTSCDAS